jgi:hypothetical protein
LLPAISQLSPTKSEAPTVAEQTKIDETTSINLSAKKIKQSKKITLVELADISKNAIALQATSPQTQTNIPP